MTRVAIITNLHATDQAFKLQASRARNDITPQSAVASMKKPEVLS